MEKLIYLLAWTMIGLALTASMRAADCDVPAPGRSIYTPYTFSTLAGNAEYGSADGTGSNAQFNYPSSVAVDSVGNVYVADAQNNTIRKVTPAGVVTTLAGLAGSEGSADGTGSTARFSGPVGVAVDSADNVYVADIGNSTIRKVTPAGLVTTLAGRAGSYGSEDGPGSTARFGNPHGVAVDSEGNIYVADSENHTIRKVTSAGLVTTLAGLAGSNGSADGTGSAAQFNYPSSVAVDSAGNVYVADSGNNTIRKVTLAGVVTTLAGLAGNVGSEDGTGSDARFHHPGGVAMDNAGNVYVVGEVCYSTIRKVTPAGEVTTLAGRAFSYGSADGTGSDARFYYPEGVAVDSAGNVYVADSRNNTIRKGYPAPMILNSGPSFGFNGGQFGFNLTGPVGKSVIVEASTDLANWLPLWTNTFTFPAALYFSDPQSGTQSKRFYRIRLP
ncbi:MAG: hypothetical protein HY043_22880 [Verrucomicrobia bacterium]|nr:hypothetical protein [Verrucomicrobiota bacterium]